jgi:hypothetical protein
MNKLTKIFVAFMLFLLLVIFIIGYFYADTLFGIEIDTIKTNITTETQKNIITNNKSL